MRYKLILFDEETECAENETYEEIKTRMNNDGYVEGIDYYVEPAE